MRGSGARGHRSQSITAPLTSSRNWRRSAGDDFGDTTVSNGRLRFWSAFLLSLFICWLTGPNRDYPTCNLLNNLRRQSVPTTVRHLRRALTPWRCRVIFHPDFGRNDAHRNARHTRGSPLSKALGGDAGGYPRGVRQLIEQHAPVAVGCRVDPRPFVHRRLAARRPHST